MNEKVINFDVIFVFERHCMVCPDIDWRPEDG